MAELTPDELAALLKRNLPPVDHRGEIIEEIGTDFVRLRLPVLDEYLSHDLPAGSGRVVLSGPVLMGFAETALYACAHAFYGGRARIFTLTYHISFLRTAGAGDLIAVARLLQPGKHLAFLEAHLYSGIVDRPCAHATASYSIG